MAARRWPWIASAVVVIATVVMLRLEGRRWWCACGSQALWISDAWGPHTSQHFLDPYSFSHVTHGIVFGGLVWLFARSRPFGWQFCCALALECIFELAENSDAVVARFRAATAAAGYEGDTVLNSLGDILSCALGIVLARRLGFWWSLALAAAIEAVLLVWIRDNLLLDIVMLINPIEAVRAWQVGH
jgi:Protein of unknown function (DUF2585)